METFTTEEQQVEAIKRFWQENGVSLIAGVTLGLAGVYGYNYYQDEKLATAEQASIDYTVAIEKLANSTDDAEKFIDANSKTGYADLAAFMLAKQFVTAKALDKAAEQLRFVAENSSSTEVKALANFRLARILFSQQQVDKALALISKPFPKAFDAQVSELKGDIYLSQGKAQQARSAYQSAADNGGLMGNPSLQMKLDDLAVNNSVVAS